MCPPVGGSCRGRTQRASNLGQDREPASLPSEATEGYVPNIVITETEVISGKGDKDLDGSAGRLAEPHPGCRLIDDTVVRRIPPRVPDWSRCVHPNDTFDDRLFCSSCGSPGTETRTRNPADSVGGDDVSEPRLSVNYRGLLGDNGTHTGGGNRDRRRSHGPRRRRSLVVSLEQATALINLIGTTEWANALSSAIPVSGPHSWPSPTPPASPVMPRRSWDPRARSTIVSRSSRLPRQTSRCVVRGFFGPRPRSVVMWTEADGVHFTQVDYCDVPRILAEESSLLVRADHLRPAIDLRRVRGGA